MAVLQETTVETAIARSAWEEALDPSLREEAREYLRSLLTYPRAFHSAADENIRAALRKRADQFPHLAGFSPSGSGSANSKAQTSAVIIGSITFFLAFCILRFEGGLPAFFALLVGANIALVVYLRQIAQVPPPENVQRNNGEALIDPLLPQALEQIGTKRNERAYVSAVLDLLPSDADTYLSSELRQEQMNNLKLLLESSRQIEAVREQIGVVLREASSDMLADEIEALQQRIDATTDELTRATLTQSQALCQERLERNNALAITLQRLDAESELVYQTFGATRSMLASLHFSPTHTSSFAAGDTSRVVEVAETISRQTRSVEAAVQELGLRSG